MAFVFEEALDVEAGEVVAGAEHEFFEAVDGRAGGREGGVLAGAHGGEDEGRGG